ncbi:MAG: heme lyase CcmF/NrfE family subunit [Hyphomicrobium sp.]|uniref:heme lyase CcmF/NrfE family subunit n=1 Tax=Hyphomicrobium sp. TaxID=82 RepID=UPI003D0D404B
MIIELGHFALILALLVALAQTVVPAWGARRRDPRLMAFAVPAAVAQLALILIAFLALAHAYVTSDFSVANVAANSHSTKPLIYRISGVWGNHEGSMLLWVLILAIFGAAVALFGTNLPATLKANVLAVQSSIATAFLLFILITSNPFERLDPAPFDGNGLNPILQDPALAFHPPFLYMGYVGFSMAFSFAIAALIEGRTDAAWARWVRPWTLLAWMCLTIGIAMGSWWAYYELGWGGWWFWDPVENASFMPWLVGTALLHSAIVMEKREALKIWTVLLAILTFSLSLMGTFLVRSGVISSVHSFAVDPGRGIFVLSIMAIFTGGGLALYAHRARVLAQGGIFSPISREGSLVLNNVLLTVACVTVLAGTLFPLVREAMGSKSSVGAPYFNMTFVPLMVPLLLAIPLGPMLAWKRADFAAAMERLLTAGMLAVLVMVAVFAAERRGPWLAPFFLAIGVWVMGGALSDLAFRVKAGKVPAADSLRRLMNLPRSAIGTTLAHFGIGLLVCGIVGTSAYKSEAILIMKPGDTTEIAGYELAFRGAAPSKGPNYTETLGVFDVTRAGTPVIRLEPSKRLYDAPPQPTSEAGIYASWGGDLYTVLGDQQADGGYAIRLYFHPLVRFIWIGAVIMFLGGAVSLSDRRLRVGAPRRAARDVAAVPAE